MSATGLAILFERSGGKLTPEMAEIIDETKFIKPHAEAMIVEIRKIWDEWDAKEIHTGDEALEYDSFYNAFMSPYFSSPR